MPDEKQIGLAKYRLQNSEEKLDTAKLLVSAGKYKDAVNRTYYAVFSAMRAVLALESTDFKRHSGVISYFRKEYIKTGIFPVECSRIIDRAFQIRTQSDYDDFFLVSKEDAELQLISAETFYRYITAYMEQFVVN